MSQRPPGSVALHLRLPLWAFFALGCIASGMPRIAEARQQTIAISGDFQPQGGGALLSGVSAATINNDGDIVFFATLAEGIGGVDSASDVAIWRVADGTRESIARKGMGDLNGASFGTFAAVSIADDGDVVIRAATDQNRQGLWRLPLAGGVLPIAMTNAGLVPGPGLTTANFMSISFPLVHSASDVAAYSARLVAQTPTVPGNTVRGAWLDADGVGSLMARERITDVPDVHGAKFFTPTVEGVNNAGQIALLAALVANLGGVVRENELGIWIMDGAGGKLIARSGSGDVAGVADSSYASLSELRINSAGQLAFIGELEQTGSITAENNRGIWRYDGTANSLIARTAGAAPGLQDAALQSLDAPLLNDAGQVLFSGAMKPGVGGVSTATSRGVWIADASGGSFVARSGVGGVPGVPTARFGEFGALAFNGDGVAALSATLETGPGGVTAATGQGIWLMDAAGDGQLIARAGDTLAGRTIASADFTGGSGGGDGRQRSLNEHGQLVYKASFTNGEEGLFLHTPDLKWRAGGSGAWDLSSNWTLGITPAAVHEVNLSPHSALTVVGPAEDATVKKLTLGGGSGVATLELAAGSELTVSEGLHLAANGLLTGKGTLVGQVINSGATSPGTSTGVLAINGDYMQQATGRLSIELGGVDNSSPLQAQFDQLLVFGHAALAGTLEVSLVGGFIPAIGDTFEILRATGGLTTFDAFELPALPSNRTWSTVTSIDALALSVVAAAPLSPADFNGDGHVDSADLQAWKEGFGSSSGGPASGDANGDGVVDGRDFLVWQREFTGAPGGGANVPEPASVVLGGLALAAMGATVARRSRRRRPAIVGSHPRST